MQKRARNLAAEELLIEVIASRGCKGFGDTRVEHSSHHDLKIKTNLLLLMFG